MRIVVGTVVNDNDDDDDDGDNEEEDDDDEEEAEEDDEEEEVSTTRPYFPIVSIPVFHRMDASQERNKSRSKPNVSVHSPVH